MANADESSELPGWVQTVMEAYSNWDVDKIVACMTDDVIREVKPLGDRVQGTEAVREMLRGNEDFSSDVRVEPGQLMVVTDEVWALEWTMSGTNDRGRQSTASQRRDARSASRGCRSDVCVTARSPRSASTSTPWI